ncbi:radical SAM family heme chaperone HemW [Carnimonas nigrificans]|uniref:radical SAM family heme chaperone HemW n=1 Tax=Carnimonas nigrificans TaxID=64323 RepID=UPI00046F067A|nr:radical SAM family heme chaperone HemW [Carnimonas nigrificans]
MTALPPLSLYIHVPWCVRKCPYCDFNSHGVGHNAELPEDAYIDALIDDLAQDLAMVEARPLHSIFIGGGTPSLLSPAVFQRLFSEIRARIPFTPDIEITLEANPGTVERSRFDGFREAGINRLSLGIQSFNDAHLTTLGRIHSGDDAEQAVLAARSAGFDNFNIDIMHGLPGQRVSDALADIERALSLAPAHLSWYQLTLEPNTEFYSHPPRLPEEETLFDIQDEGHERLKQAGFERYEISAYARSPAQRSRHNLNYWQFGDYLGIGAGAHGKVTRTDNGRLSALRRWKSRQPDAYLRRRADPRGYVAGQQVIGDDEIGLEFLLNALRLVEGVETELWSARTGLSLEALERATARVRQRGLLTLNQRIATSDKGLAFLNDVLADIEPPA